MLTKELRERILKEKPFLREIGDDFAQYLINQGYMPLEIHHAWTLAQLDYQGEGLFTQQAVCKDI